MKCVLELTTSISFQVYTATVKAQSTETDDHVVLKVIDVPRGPFDPCRFFDVFSEVEILEKFVGEPRICQILDYGVEAETFILVLKHYKCSLRDWRERHENPSTRAHVGVQQQVFYKTLPLYLEVYSAVLQAVSTFSGLSGSLTCKCRDKALTFQNS